MFIFIEERCALKKDKLCLNGKNSMNSFLYRAKVMHNRFSPKKHRFHYNVFLFCIDIDKIDEDFKKISFISRNRFNLFSFYDKDHLELGIPFGVKKENLEKLNVRDNLNIYLKKNGIEKLPAKIL